MLSVLVLIDLHEFVTNFNRFPDQCLQFWHEVFLQAGLKTSMAL